MSDTPQRIDYYQVLGVDRDAPADKIDRVVTGGGGFLAAGDF